MPTPKSSAEDSMPKQQLPESCSFVFFMPFHVYLSIHIFM
jgi:hypothetical protein